MNPQSFGSFGNVASDDMSAIKDAMARRGIGDQVPALDTQSTAGTNPSPLPAEAQGSASMGAPATASPAVSPQLTPQGNPEAKLIIGALKIWHRILISYLQRPPVFLPLIKCI